MSRDKTGVTWRPITSFIILLRSLSLKATCHSFLLRLSWYWCEKPGYLCTWVGDSAAAARASSLSLLFASSLFKRYSNRKVAFLLGILCLHSLNMCMKTIGQEKVVFGWEWMKTGSGPIHGPSPRPPNNQVFISIYTLYRCVKMS